MALTPLSFLFTFDAHIFDQAVATRDLLSFEAGPLRPLDFVYYAWHPSDDFTWTPEYFDDLVAEEADSQVANFHVFNEAEKEFDVRPLGFPVGPNLALSGISNIAPPYLPIFERAYCPCPMTHLQPDTFNFADVENMDEDYVEQRLIDYSRSLLANSKTNKNRSQVFTSLPSSATPHSRPARVSRRQVGRGVTKKVRRAAKISCKQRRRNNPTTSNKRKFGVYSILSCLI